MPVRDRSAVRTGAGQEVVVQDLAREQAPLRVAVIVGSTRPGRFADTVVAWLVDVLGRRDGLEVDVIDLAEEDLPPTWTRDRTPGLRTFAKRVAAADAFVVVTPEYNHSFPAPLKHAIDLLRDEWRAKPVGFVSYGGTSGGLRAVEQLRTVFAELHVVTVKDAVSFHRARASFDADGRPVDAARATDTADRMLGQLTWWGRVLADARRDRPLTA